MAYRSVKSDRRGQAKVQCNPLVSSRSQGEGRDYVACVPLSESEDDRMGARDGYPPAMT